jgi:hypothetical protein
MSLTYLVPLSANSSFWKIYSSTGRWRSLHFTLDILRVFISGLALLLRSAALLDIAVSEVVFICLVVPIIFYTERD